MPSRPTLAFTLVAALAAALAAGATLAGGGGPPAASPPPPAGPVGATFTNPVLGDDFADPDIVRVGGTYWAYSTNSSNRNVPTFRSNDLVSWSFAGDALPDLPAWASAGFTWAPEVLPLPSGAGAGRYAMYYTARHTDSGRQCIGVASASRPEGPFVSPSSGPLVCQLVEGGSIDASPFMDRDGSRYLYWKNDGNCCGLQTWIYAQKLSADGLSLVGSPRQLIANTELWEGSLIEAPFVYRRPATGKYYLFYSAADWNSDTYGVGVAVGFSPVGPFKKLGQNPVLYSQGEVAGPGGQGVVTDAAGQEWLYYHAWQAELVGYEAGGARSLRLEKLSWKDGLPLLRPSVAAQPAPAKR